MKNLIVLIAVFFVGELFSQNFDSLFKDETLRLDFVFEGNSKQTKVELKSILKTGKWYGRKVNLKTNNLQGDAQINVYEGNSKKIIYTQSFSTLYQEWLTQKDAKTQIQKFEQVLYIPIPKKKFRIEVVFFDKNLPTLVYKQLLNLKDHNLIRLNNLEIEFEQLNISKNKNSPINVAIVAEGFKDTEMQDFLKHANQTVNALFKHKVFATYKDQFNIYAVKSLSDDSGVSIPSKNIYLNTIANSNFDTFGAARYLTTSKLFNLHNYLAGFSFDHIIIISNSDIYGGGGIFNSYTITTHYQPTFDAVVVHEFGHSFAGLGDEYFYENDIFSENAHQNTVEPWVKNNTTLVNFESKWKNKLATNTIIPTQVTNDGTDALGVYLGIKGGKVYIPHQDCRMHTNSAIDFCSVCSDAIEDLIMHYTKDF